MKNTSTIPDADRIIATIYRRTGRLGLIAQPTQRATEDTWLQEAA